MSDYMRELRQVLGNRLLGVPSVSVISRDAAGRVLLVRHENGNVWVTPGGAIEPNEVPADAAAREMWEETGLEVQITGLLGAYGGPEFVVTYANGDRTSYVMLVFEGRPVGGELRPDGVETLEVRYFDRDEVRTLATPGWLAEVLDGVLGGTPFRPASWTPYSAD